MPLKPPQLIAIVDYLDMSYGSPNSALNMDRNDWLVDRAHQEILEKAAALGITLKEDGSMFAGINIMHGTAILGNSPVEPRKWTDLLACLATLVGRPEEYGLDGQAVAPEDRKTRMLTHYLDVSAADLDMFPGLRKVIVPAKLHKLFETLSRFDVVLEYDGSRSNGLNIKYIWAEGNLGHVVVYMRDDWLPELLTKLEALAAGLEKKEPPERSLCVLDFLTYEDGASFNVTREECMVSILLRGALSWAQVAGVRLTYDFSKSQGLNVGTKAEPRKFGHVTCFANNYWLRELVRILVDASKVPGIVA